jgi:hypothetical protein
MPLDIKIHESYTGSSKGSRLSSSKADPKEPATFREMYLPGDANLEGFTGRKQGRNPTFAGSSADCDSPGAPTPNFNQDQWGGSRRTQGSNNNLVN